MNSLFHCILFTLYPICFIFSITLFFLPVVEMVFCFLFLVICSSLFCHSSPCSPHSRPSDIVVVSRICQAVPPPLLPTLSHPACAWLAPAPLSASASRMCPPRGRLPEPCLASPSPWFPMSMVITWPRLFSFFSNKCDYLFML